MLHDKILSRSGLYANGGVPTSSDHHNHVFQLFLKAFIVSVLWRMKCNIMRFQKSVAFDWYRKIVFIDFKVENGYSRKDVDIV